MNLLPLMLADLTSARFLYLLEIHHSAFHASLDI